MANNLRKMAKILQEEVYHNIQGQPEVYEDIKLVKNEIIGYLRESGYDTGVLERSTESNVALK